MKRSKDILLLIEEFIIQFKGKVLNQIDNVEYINDKIYASKLIFNKQIIFDISIDNDLIIWEIYKNKFNFTTGEKEEYYQQQVQDIIEGNQFIKENLEHSDVSNLLKNIKENNSIEIKYCLDSLQTKILNDFEYGYNNYQAISGSAGSGKTLMLNRLAYKSIQLGKNYIYIAFTVTLKDRFKIFINNILGNTQNIKFCVYTYEEFLRDYIAPKLNINSDEYITFNECSVITKKVMNKYDLIKNDFTVSDLTRLIMSMGTNLSFDKKEYNNSEILDNRLTRLVSTNDLVISDKQKDVILKVFEEINLYIKKSKKKLWENLILDINESISNNKIYIDSDYIFIDEMQDMSQSEYTLLYKIIEGSLSKNKKLIVAYDTNQRISFNGSSERNLKNRLKCEPIKLINNYRNSYSICKLSNYFIDEDNLNLQSNIDLKVNISNSQVKIIIESDVEHLVKSVLNKFIPEENLNIGVLAFGKAYEKYREFFVDEFGKSKFLGIEYFNEEEIKGLEFTNLIIIDFMEPLRNKKEISSMNMRRWYVGISRACENLLIHFSDKKEFQFLIDNIEYKKNIKEEYLNDDQLVVIFEDTEEAFEKFNDDLLVSLGDEQRSIILNKGKKLIQSYEYNSDLEQLDEGIDLFYRADALESLINILEQIVNKDSEIYLQIIFAAIKVNSKEKINKYINNINKIYHWKLIEFAENNNIDILKYLQSEKKIKNNKKEMLKKIENEVYKFKQKGQFDEIIKKYYKEHLFDKVIKFYEQNVEEYDSRSIKLIGKSYLKLAQKKKAIDLFYNNNCELEVIKIYELEEDSQKALDMCIDYLRNKQNLNNQNDYDIIQKSVELSLKISNLNLIKILIEILEKFNPYKKEYKLDELSFEAYILSKDLKFLLKSIKYNFYGKNYKSVIRCFKKEKEKILKDREKYKEIINIIIRSYESIRDDCGLALLYFELEEYGKALSIYFNNNDCDDVIAIYEIVKDTYSDDGFNNFKNQYKNEIILSYKNQNKIQKAISICEDTNEIVMGITIAYEYELYEKVIKLYEVNKFKYFKQNEVNENIYLKISEAYQEQYKYEESGDIQIYLGYIYEAIIQYNKAHKYEKIICIFEKILKNKKLENYSKKEFIYDISKNGKNYISDEKFNEIIDIIIESCKYLNNKDKELKACLISGNHKKYCNEIIELYYEMKDYEKLKSYYYEKKYIIMNDYSNKSLNYIYKVLLFEKNKENNNNKIEINKELKNVLLKLLNNYSEIYKIYVKLENFSLNEVITDKIKSKYDLLNVNLKLCEIKDIYQYERIKYIKIKNLIDLKKHNFNKLYIGNYTINDIVEGKIIENYNKELKYVLEQLLMYKQLYNSLQIKNIISNSKILNDYMDIEMKLCIKEILFDFVNRNIYNADTNLDELTKNSQLIHIINKDIEVVYKSLDWLKENNLVISNDDKKGSYILINKINEVTEYALYRYQNLKSQKINEKISKENELIKIKNNIKQNEKKLKKYEGKTGEEVSRKYESEKKLKENLEKDKKDIEKDIEKIKNEHKKLENARSLLLENVYKFFKDYLILFSKNDIDVKVEKLLNHILEYKLQNNEGKEGYDLLIKEILNNFKQIKFNNYIKEKIEKYNEKKQDIICKEENKLLREDEKNMDNNLTEKENVKNALIGVVARGILINNLTDEVLSSITDISIEEIRQIRAVMNMDQDLLEMLLDIKKKMIQDIEK